MAGLSRITLIGNLGRDPETSYTPSGLLRVQFTMAVSRRYRDQSGQQQENTNWFRVSAVGKLAEVMDNLSQQGYLKKGKQVFVEGRFEAREYQDREGTTRTSLDVQANEMQLLGSREGGEFGDDFGRGGGRPGGSGGGGRQGQQDDPEGPGNIDDVPF